MYVCCKTVQEKTKTRKWRVKGRKKISVTLRLQRYSFSAGSVIFHLLVLSILHCFQRGNRYFLSLAFTILRYFKCGNKEVGIFQPVLLSILR